MKHFRVYRQSCVLMIVMLASASAFATTIVMPTDEQLVAKSPVIVEGTVVSSTPFSRGNAIWTETKIDVAKTLKGNAAGTITIRELGGIIDNRITKIFGAPEYAVGEHVLVFLTPTPRGDYQTTDLYVGKFTEERTLDGRMLWSRHDEASGVVLLDSNFNPIAARNVQRDAAKFDTFMSDRVAGRKGANNYGIENPVLDTIADGNRGARTKDNFTVISEPTIYRWFVFDSGGSASWRSYGTQPGYAGGGVNEIQTAMNAWNGYSAALINYQYAGVEAGTPAGLNGPNGVNEVLFNDPLSEISGSWNPSTGGVVGQGGFNGVSGSHQWASPFAADATHTQKTYTAFNITEGNLTIQDNVSSSTGISSTRLAEIVAHEFGHTLGFGHSTDNTALMYPSVTGIGPSLRVDDQLGARWLYPNGSQNPPPGATVPAAPTNLQATIVGANVNLTWNDNANNETGESIYVSFNNGAFSKVTDVSAGTTSSQLTGFTTGTYAFYVIAYNSAGNSAPSNTANVTFGSTLQAAFAVNALSGVAGQTNFQFTDQSTGSITSRLWTFGDGGTSSIANPSHVYATAGQYTVTLTVNSNSTSSQTTRTIFVSSPSAPLSAAFTWTPSAPTTATTITFLDQSTSATAWSWNFGDGSGSNSQSPTKKYNFPGTYTVTLTAFNGINQSSVSHAVVVASSTPATPPVVAGFNFSPSNPVNGQTVSFDDTTTGAPTTWSWNFGDGTGSNAQRPTHAFANPGTYTVTLTTSNATSSSSISHTIAVAQATFTTRTLVSASAQTNGVGGSQWRTELTLFNAGGSASLDLIFMAGDGTILTRTIFLGTKQSVTYANALLDVFGLTSGAGAIAIEATSNAAPPDIRSSSRTFTGGTLGTYGQAVPEVTATDLPSSTYLTAITSNASYRTNIGIVNRSADFNSVNMALYDANGSLIGAANLSIAPSSFQQLPLSTYFPAMSGRTLDAGSIVVTATQPGAISVYASVIDNRTQDPIYVQATPLRTTGSAVIPAIGRAGGLNGTFWRSDVTLYNPTGGNKTISMRMLIAGADNRAAASQNVTLGSGQTLVLADVASRFLGTANSNGALELSWNGTAPVIASRTYTTDGNGGTFGQSIDPIAAYGSTQYVPGLRSDASFRTNAGFVNSSDQTIGVTLSLISASGATIANGFVAMPPKSQSQFGLGSLFPGVNVNNLGNVTLQAHTDNGAVMFAFGSIVDNASGDPVFFGGK